MWQQGVPVHRAHRDVLQHFVTLQYASLLSLYPFLTINSVTQLHVTRSDSVFGPHAEAWQSLGILLLWAY